jgi:hypothetical protein
MEICMARHRLTKEEQKRGTEKALANPRTPPQLRKGLKKRQAQLEGTGQSKLNGSQSKSNGGGNSRSSSKQSNSRERESDSEDSDT